MTALLRCLEACLLTAMGIFMAIFALSEGYWQIINPKYSWLTFLAGVLVILVGISNFFHTHRKPKLTELVGVVIFLCMALAALLGPNPFVSGSIAEDLDSGQYSEQAGDGYTGGSLTLQYDDTAVPSPEVTFGGEAFTKMNLAELLAGEEGGWVEPGGRYAVQGAMLRTPELDAAGYIAFGRLYINCCFADAVGVLALVKVDHPQAYRSGSWGRALGILQKDTPFPGLALRIAGAFSTARSDQFVLKGVEVKETPMQGIPFMLEVREKTPFDY